MARPERPPLSATSSSMRVQQSSTTAAFFASLVSTSASVAIALCPSYRFAREDALLCAAALPQSSSKSKDPKRVLVEKELSRFIVQVELLHLRLAIGRREHG